MQIHFNGNTYNSLDEMPANERQAFEHLQKIFVDANGNGIPDFMEGDVAAKIMTAISTNTINFNGQVYNNISDLPPETRQKVEAAMAKLQQMGFALPQGTNMSSGNEPQLGFEPAFTPSKPIVQPEPVIQEVKGPSGMLIALALTAVLVACSVAGVAILLLLRR